MMLKPRQKRKKKCKVRDRSFFYETEGGGGGGMATRRNWLKRGGLGDKIKERGVGRKKLDQNRIRDTYNLKKHPVLFTTNTAKTVPGQQGNISTAFLFYNIYNSERAILTVLE